MNITQAIQLRNTVANNAQESSRRIANLSNNDLNGIEKNDHASRFKQQQLETVAKDFEKIFVNMLFTSMRETLNKKEDILYGGYSQEIFEDMLYEKYAEEVASTNYLGFGQMIVSEYEKYI